MSAGNRRGRRRGGKQVKRVRAMRAETDATRYVPTPAVLKLAGCGMVGAQVQRSATARNAELASQLREAELRNGQRGSLAWHANQRAKESSNATFDAMTNQTNEGR